MNKTGRKISKQKGSEPRLKMLFELAESNLFDIVYADSQISRELILKKKYPTLTRDEISFVSEHAELIIRRDKENNPLIYQFLQKLTERIKQLYDVHCDMINKQAELINNLNHRIDLEEKRNKRLIRKKLLDSIHSSNKPNKRGKK